MRLNANGTAMAFYNLFANGQSNTGATVLRAVVQALKYNENLFIKPLIYANAIIFNFNIPIGRIFTTANMNLRSLIGLSILNGI